MHTVLRNTLVWSFWGLTTLIGYVGSLYLCIWIFVTPLPIGMWVLFAIWIVWTAFLIALLSHHVDKDIRVRK